MLGVSAMNSFDDSASRSSGSSSENRRMIRRTRSIARPCSDHMASGAPGSSSGLREVVYLDAVVVLVGHEQLSVRDLQVRRVVELPVGGAGAAER